MRFVAAALGLEAAESGDVFMQAAVQALLIVAEAEEAFAVAALRCGH